MQSESIKNLAVALNKFQSEIKPAGKNASNPFFHSKYADLESIVESCKVELFNNGLAVVQLPICEENQIGVNTIVTHTSGEWISGKLLFPIAGKNLAQAGGSVISYARRYSYASMLGIVTGEDNDGNNNSQVDSYNKQPQQQSTPKTQPARQTIPQQKEQLQVDLDLAKKNEVIKILKVLGLTNDEAKFHASKRMGMLNNNIDTVLNEVQRLGTNFYWDVTSKQFLQK